MTHPLTRRTLLAAASASALPAFAQTDYPNKPIKVIVPFPAGGGGDILARTSMTRVGRELGQPIVFENVAGAGGNVGSVAALKSPADGYTLLYGTNGTLCANHVLYKNAGFDPLKDLMPVSRLTRLGLVAVVRPGLEVSNMNDLLNMIRANPGRLSYASAGNGTTSHLAVEILKSQARLSILHIPYRGGAPAITALLAGQIDMMIEVQPNAIPHIKSGRLKALAVSTLARSSALPETPTMADSGLPGFEVSAWDAIVAPVGTPTAIVTALNRAIARSLADPDLVKTLDARGASASPTSPDEFERFMKSEIDRWAGAVKRSGASVD